MEASIDPAARALASDVLKEAAAEVTGRSNRKWAVALVALVLGAAIAVYLMRASNAQSGDRVPSNDPGDDQASAS